MTNSELFYSAAKCLALDVRPELREEVASLLQRDDFSSDRFVSLCDNHLILPSIYPKFEKHDLLRFLPDELAVFLKEVHHLNELRNTLILELVDDIISCLNREGILAVLLKGCGNLADGLYKNAGDRLMSDIDVLVENENYHRAADVLLANGYVYMEEYKYFKGDTKHLPHIMKPGTVAQIEIHFIPVDKPYDKWFNLSRIKKSMKKVDKYESCYVLSDQDNIALNFIHSQLGHSNYFFGIAPLRDLYDVLLLSSRTPLPEAIQHTNAKKKAYAYYRFAAKVFALPELNQMPATFASRCFEKRLNWNLNSRTFFEVNRIVVFIGLRFRKYGLILTSLFYSPEFRKHLYVRLTSPQWYREHFRFYTRFFRKEI